MTGLATLVKRNIRLFFADKSSVAFSLIGALMAVLLVLFLLKTVIVDSLTAGFADLTDREQADHLLDAWLVASASVIASGTTGLGALRQFVHDRETANWRDFLASPLPRWMITLGYLLAATIIAMVMTTVVYLGSTAYCLANGMPLAWSDAIVSWGWLMLCCLGFTALMGFAVSWMKTVGAHTGLSVVVSTAFGFLAETYVTPNGLPAAVSRFLHCLPCAQASALVRQTYTTEAVAALPEPLRAPTIEAMGITIKIGATAVTTPVIVAVLAAMAVVGYLLAWRTMARTVAHHF